MFKFRSDTKVKLKSKNDNFLFQALDWKGVDLDMSEESSDSEDSEEKGYKKKNHQNIEYVIKAYGVSKEGYSTCLYIKGFQPFFYLRIPEEWTMKEAKLLQSRLTSDVYYKHRDAIVDMKIIKRKELYYFQNNEKFQFIQFTFKTYGAFCSYRKQLEKPMVLKSVFGNKEINFSKVASGFGLYESKLDPALRFIHLRDLDAAGWIQVKKKKWNNGFETNCQMEGVAQWKDVYPVDSNDISKMLIASFDIECVSGDGSFPDPERDTDMVIQIGTTVHRSGEEDVCLKHIVTLGKCKDIEGAIVECCTDEKELLRTWCKFINKLQPDVMTGYNIWGFDWKFLWKRAERLKCTSYFLEMGKVRNGKNKIHLDKELSSSAKGQNFLTYLDIEGVVQIDLMKLIQTDFKLDSYTLNNVAKNFTGQTKEDLNHKQLFANFKKGDPDSLREIATYCIQDNVLCNKLIIKLSVITNNLGMANVCSVPFTYLFIRGQGIKLFSLVAKRCRQEGVLVPTIYKDDVNPDSYEGAIVFIPDSKIHYNPIAVLDYSALYPSCIIAENMSHDTLVSYYEYDAHLIEKNGVCRPISREEVIKMKPKDYDKTIEEGRIVRGTLQHKFGREELLNLPDYNYNKITYDILVHIDPKNPEKGKRKVGEKDCIFAYAKDGTKGILPRILVDLLAARRNTRAKIGFKTITLKGGKQVSGKLSEKDGVYSLKTEFDGVVKVNKDNVESIKDTYSDFMKSILDGLQLAYKVVCNSLYGQTGASTSPICLKELAASTTAAGRGMLILARKEVLTAFPKSECVYGDSVTAETPVLVKRDNEIKYIKISELADNWSNCVEDGKEEKEYCALEGVEAWSDKGWTPVRNVIRHILAPHKKVYTVYTNSSFVEVTDDHSLLNENGEEVKPTKLKIGDKLLSHPCPEIKVKNNCYTKDENVITNIKEIDYSGYVYDLTTENHHFQAGVGSIIVHNTDSVFIDFTPYLKEKNPDWDNFSDEEKIKLTIHAGESASKEVQKVIKDPHVLEYEKIFYPFAIFTKKRYFGNKYEFDPSKFKQTSMGIALKRRGYAQIVKEIYSGVIKIILNERNEEDIKRETIEYFRKMVDDLLEGNISMDKLIITQSLRADYSNPTTIKHKILADRIGKRDPGNKPASNDRIPYCYIDLKNLRCYKKGCDKKIINTKKCKCRGCMELFCGVHLNSHECEIVCRFCRVPREICSVCISGEKGHCNCNVKECKTCLGWYCPDDMIKHDQFIIKKTGEVDHTRNKCKKPIDLKTILGDVVEDPTFIKENNLSIDYRRYLDNQISKPILQIFSLMIENPNQILHDILIGDDNRKSGMKSIGSYFGGGFSNGPLKKEIKSKQKKCVEENKNKTVAIKKQITMNNFFNTKPVNLDDMLRDIKNKRKVIKDKSKKKEVEKEKVEKKKVEKKKVEKKKIEKKKVDKKDNVKIEIKKSDASKK
jgi:DNA polymerase elongation subunit (family B)